VRARIHRGAREIGGNCVELASDEGSRIVLDLGRPLSAEWGEEVGLPDVSGLKEADPSLLAVLISHPHIDHYGLLTGLQTSVPIYMGKEAASVISAASFFSPVSGELHPSGYLKHRQPFHLGPFRVTPFLADHSAFDAYSLLVEADGRRLFYSGDIRAHGRKAAMFEGLLANPPEKVDVLLMEGTHVRLEAAHDGAVLETESNLEERFVDLCHATPGAVVAFGSAQNLDRLVTVYRAAKRSGRRLVVDLYGATVAAATRQSIPQPGFPGLCVYVPYRQRVKVKKAEQFGRVEAVKSCRVFPEALAASPGQFLLYVPSSTAGELINDGVLDQHGVAVWSMWDGYLEDDSGIALKALLDESKVELVHLHTSGHASVKDLRRLVDAINPQRVVPIHSEATNRFAELFPRVEPHEDGEWWGV